MVKTSKKEKSIITSIEVFLFIVQGIMHFFLNSAVKPKVALVLLSLLLFFRTFFVLFTDLVYALSGKVASLGAYIDDFVYIGHDPLKLIWTEGVQDEVIHVVILLLSC